MKDLVATFARFLVDDPDRVSVRERNDQGRLVLELAVAPSDRGRVIGKGGEPRPPFASYWRRWRPGGDRV